jgi:hypothetical protein
MVDARCGPVNLVDNLTCRTPFRGNASVTASPVGVVNSGWLRGAGADPQVSLMLLRHNLLKPGNPSSCEEMDPRVKAAGDAGKFRDAIAPSPADQTQVIAG